MKKIKYLSLALLIALIFNSSFGFSQDKYYELTSAKEIKTTSTENQKRVGTCWSNAGVALLEAEMLRLGKDPVDLSTQQFVYSAYNKKADVTLNGNTKLKVDPSGIAYDVITLAKEYGMIPESEFMYPESEMTSAQKQGEMDAVLRGTLNMIQQKGEGFSERWQNVYSTSLLRYMGEPKIEFTHNGVSYNANTFAGAAGLNFDDYILMTWMPQSDMHTEVDPELRQNWANNPFYNVQGSDMVEAIKGCVDGGYTVVWYGPISDSQVFGDENMALVPAGDFPGQSEAEEQEAEPEYKPFAEKQITPDMHTELMKLTAQKDQDYLLIYGMSADQEGNTYFTAKYVCESGDKTLNLSVPFVELNTVYLMMNKNGLPSALKDNLDL